MISPYILMEDLDEGGFALLEEHVSRRDLGGGAELHVLHESGEVVSVVHTRQGPLPGPHPRLVDLSADAARLRAEHDVARVVLLDGAAYDPVEDPGLVSPRVPQPELFAALTERFWASPAVVADPSPAPSRWREVAALLRRLGEGHVLLVVAEEGRPVIRLQGRLEHGLLVRVSTLDLGAPPEGVVLDLRLSVAELEGLLAAPDVAAALLALPQLQEAP